MSKYKNAKIYCITNDIDNYKYIGSTCKRLLNDRLFLHLCDSTKPPSYKHTYTSKLYEHIRKLGQYNFNIELLEEYPCSNDFEMRCREQYWLDTYTDKSLLLNERRAVGLKKYKKSLEDGGH